MAPTEQLTKLLHELTAEEIRARMNELEADQDGLRILYRAALVRERKLKQSRKQREEAA